MRSARRRRRSPAVVALDAVGAVGPGRLLPSAVMLGGLSLAALGPLIGDPYATATGLTVAGLAVAWLLARHALQHSQRPSTSPARLRSSSGRPSVDAAAPVPADRARPHAPAPHRAIVDAAAEQSGTARTAGQPTAVPSQERRRTRQGQDALM